MVEVKVKQLENAKNQELPLYETEQSAGMDLKAAIDSDIIIKPLERKLVPTGLAIALPDGYEAQIRPRSGLAYKNGITVLNSPGTIDADYRGEISVILVNLGSRDFTISRGMRVAQMVINQYAKAKLTPVAKLDDTARGEGGFGSTGTDSKKGNQAA